MSRPKTKKTPTSERVVQAVMDDTEIIEDLRLEGFLRGCNNLSASGKMAIELGIKEMKKLPVLPERAAKLTGDQALKK